MYGSQSNRDHCWVKRMSTREKGPATKTRDDDNSNSNNNNKNNVVVAEVWKCPQNTHCPVMLPVGFFFI